MRVEEMASTGRMLAIVAATALLWSLTGTLVYWVALAPILPSLGGIVAHVLAPPSLSCVLAPDTGCGAAWWSSLVKVLFSLAAILLVFLGVVATVRYIRAERDVKIGEGGGAEERYIERLGKVDIASHLLVLLGGFLAGITGFTMHFADNPFIYFSVYPLLSREALANLHVVGGFAMAAGVALYLSYYVTDFVLHLPGLGFKRALSRYYFVRLIPTLPRDLTQYFAWLFGLRKEHPKYHKYMPSQVLAYYSTGVLVMLVGLTGLGMVIWGIRFLSGLAWWLHVYAAVALTALIAFHVVMGHLRPIHFPIDKTFLTGRVPLGKAREEWPLWVEEVTGGRV
ncbi:MAG: hypothetical protein QXQ34_07410 [Thermofilum sp.]